MLNVPLESFSIRHPSAIFVSFEASEVEIQICFASGVRLGIFLRIVNVVVCGCCCCAAVSDAVVVIVVVEVELLVLV